QLENGEQSLEWDERHGWLPALLESLDVPRTSQTLVFSKTSRQHQRINPSRPRALYFNDDVYIGWVRSGDFVEVAAVDPVQGAVFYTVDQHNAEQAIITRDTGQCLSCHANANTGKVPGFVVRSVFPKPDGHPDYRLGTTATDHTTPFADRYGGWYVTGNHGDMRHRGNVAISGGDDHTLDREAGANLAELPENVKTENYLEPTSDIVALMLLQHQTQMHNLVTRASYETRQAQHYQDEMNRLLKRDEDYQGESTVRRIQSAAEALVAYLLFSGEPELISPVTGNSEFANEFASAGIRDSRGRSLRDLDLDNRLLRYPCSYLIYSESFNSLPPVVLDIVKSRLTEILTGTDDSGDFAHLSAEDKRNIFEILSETHPLFANGH
ncbi:MAG: hypothetical protein ACR2NP_20095, partial [Pirellulaceae bacterium]